ncbi:hypothetical protein ACFU99_13645 [Streptomyces sp. NPDC057654]|uniref:hypothetical protein n=1 Tax=Streptomyces sp. NPDC057654 TaxID=3346196 RepID=UPI003693CE15
MTTESMRASQPVSETTAKACKAAAWDCQSHAFMGSPETVMANLVGLPDELVGRRVYMLMIQGDNRSEARVFERFNLDDAEGTVSSWPEKDVPGLVTQITEVLVANRGVHCPGEQVKATLETEREVHVSAPAPAPRTAAAAFGPLLEGFRDDAFVRATVMVLC